MFLSFLCRQSSHRFASTCNRIPGLSLSLSSSEYRPSAVHEPGFVGETGLPRESSNALTILKQRLSRPTTRHVPPSASLQVKSIQDLSTLGHQEERIFHWQARIWATSQVAKPAEAVTGFEWRSLPSPHPAPLLEQANVQSKLLYSLQPSNDNVIGDLVHGRNLQGSLQCASTLKWRRLMMKKHKYKKRMRKLRIQRRNQGKR